MPSYKSKKDGRWRYRFAFRNKRYSGSTAKAYNTQRAADMLERRHLELLEARRFTGKMPTVAEFSVQFLAFQETNTKQLTYTLHETIVRVHVIPHVGKEPLEQLDTAKVVQLMLTWREKAAPRTVNTRTGVVLRMLALGVEWGILARVPKVKLLKIEEDHPRFLSDAEGAELAEAAGKQRKPAGHRWRTMVIVALRTGLRIGELRGLKWADVELDNGLLRVRRTDPGIPDLDPNAPKGNRPRTVPLTDDAIAALRAWRELVPARPSDYVFPGDTVWRDERADRGMSETGCQRAIRAAVTKAGIANGSEVSWHTLRHTFASQLVMRGVPLRAVQELLGHASIRQTERYAHLAQGFTNRALVAALDIPMAAPDASPALPPGPDPAPQTRRRSTKRPRKRRRG